MRSSAILFVVWGWVAWAQPVEPASAPEPPGAATPAPEIAPGTAPQPDSATAPATEAPQPGAAVTPAPDAMAAPQPSTPVTPAPDAAATTTTTTGASPVTPAPDAAATTSTSAPPTPPTPAVIEPPPPANAASAQDADRKPTLLAFDIEAKGVTALESEAASQAVVKGLRDLDVFEVLSAADVRQLLAIERTRQLLGADAHDSSIASLWKIFGARNSVAGTMTKVGGDMRVEIRLVDSKENRVIAQKVLGPVTRIEQIAVQLPGLAQELVGPLLDAQRGQLLVRCNEEAVEIVVGDTLVATTPMQNPVKLPRGTQRVQVRKDGFIAQVRATRILPGQTVTEEFLVIPSPDYAEAYALRHGRLRLGAYIAGGAAVALFGGAFLLDHFGTTPLYSREFLPRQLALGNVVDLPPEVQDDPGLVAKYQQCGANVPLCQIETDKLRTQLTVEQALTASMVVLGVVSTGTAGYFFFTGKDPNRYSKMVAGVAPARGGGAVVLAGTF